MPLKVERKVSDSSVAVLELSGRITVGQECQQFDNDIKDLLKAQEKKIILDFSKLDYLDSTGVGSLVMCAGHIRQAGGEVAIAGAHGMTMQTLRLTRVDQIVPLYPTVQSAAESLVTPRSQPTPRPESRGENLGRLRVETRRIGDVVLVICTGRIVAGHESESLRDQIKNFLPDNRDIILHLEDVTLIDSSGLGMLVRLVASLRAARGDLKLCNVPREIHHTLRITNLHTLFDIHASHEEAVSAFYQRTTSSTKAAPSAVSVLCVDRSTDVLAYLRELLLRAGYNPLTNNNIHDALVLLKAARPKLVILGPNPPSGHPGESWERFRKAAMSLPLVELEDDFSSREAGQAGTQLLGTVRTLLASKPGAAAQP